MINHKWIGNICVNCGIQKKTSKIIQENLSELFTTYYYDKNNKKLPARPICKKI